MSLPTFLVIGAQRAGTSLLHQILLAHPEVYVPRERKEVHYFDRYFERGVAWYEGYFPAADAARNYRAIGEITPDYLATEEAPARIHALLPGDEELKGTIERLERELHPPAVAEYEPVAEMPAPAVEPLPESPFDRTIPPFEESTGDAEPMLAAHDESPFEEPVETSTVATFEIEHPAGMQVVEAPLAAEVAAPLELEEASP